MDVILGISFQWAKTYLAYKPRYFHFYYGVYLLGTEVQRLAWFSPMFLRGLYRKWNNCLKTFFNFCISHCIAYYNFVVYLTTPPEQLSLYLSEMIKLLFLHLHLIWIYLFVNALLDRLKSRKGFHKQFCIVHSNFTNNFPILHHSPFP